jgi:hypothetical protein
MVNNYRTPSPYRPYETLERLAEASHTVWMEDKIRDGWEYCPVTDKDRKIHNCLRPYDQLSELDKESDLHLVRGIPKIPALPVTRLLKLTRQK